MAEFVISMYIIIKNNIQFIVGLGRINKTASIHKLSVCLLIGIAVDVSSSEFLKVILYGSVLTR